MDIITDTSDAPETETQTDHTDAGETAAVCSEPPVTADIGAIVYPDPCPAPIDIMVGGCQDSVTADLGDIFLEQQGSMIQFSLRLRNVCPGKRVGLAVILTEVDCNGQEYQRGMRTVTIPAHNYPTCRDIQVNCLRFVLPGDINVSDCGPGMCQDRTIRARVFANTLDTDYRCCNAETSVNPASSCGCGASRNRQKS